MKLLVNFAAFLLLFLSAASQPNDTAFKYQNLLVFPLQCRLSVIDIKDNQTLDENLSALAKQKLEDFLVAAIPSKLNHAFFKSDSLSLKLPKPKTVKSYERQYSGIFYTDYVYYNNGVYIKKGKAPLDFIRILDSAKMDFGLIVYYSGFSRTAENLKSETIRRKSIEVYSLGIEEKEPIKANAILSFILIDRKNEKIWFESQHQKFNEDPAKDWVIRSLVKLCIESLHKKSSR